MNNPLSSASYTNKDFNSIFVELLEITKQLSEKWDPTISNESDPGVILLKANAIIGDKNNYNIDKNILEAFPETVTQDINARNLYKQLSYHMPWYRSAQTEITLRYKGEELTSQDEFSIPKFTMICDATSSIVYTLIEEATFNKDTLVVSVPAMEGVITQLKVNGQPNVLLTNLDERNRIYFEDYTVAENGIFISNVDTRDRTPWQKVDNLLIQPLGTKCYEFGVDSRTETCYLEFPTDIPNLIESGIDIKYLISNGAAGNVSAQAIEKFYQETTIELNGKPLAINNENFDLINPSAATNGLDPQSISDAYLSYKKSAGTFNTLVTLRDYINAIYNSGYVSNVIVSDRNTDIQTSYTIMTDDEVNPKEVCQLPILENDFDIIAEYLTTAAIKNPEDVEGLEGGTDVTVEGQTKKVIIDSDDIHTALEFFESITTESKTHLSPFDLKLYLLHDSGNITTIQQYEDTFNVENPSFEESIVTKQVLSHIASNKCIQHNFKEMLGDTPCMYQNMYPLKMKIVPTIKLTEAQINSVKNNIIKSLFNVVSSRSQEFGEEPDYDLIYATIKNSDERIKTIILDDFTYITYAVYWDTDLKIFKKIPINSTEFKNSDLIVTLTDIEDLLTKYLPVNNTTDWNTTRRAATLFIYGDSDPINYSDLTTYYQSFLYLDEDDSINRYDILKYDALKGKFIKYSDKLTDFQKQVIIKSILSGETPLYVPTSPFKYSMSENELLQTDADTISTVSVISPYSESRNVVSKVINWNGDKEIYMPEVPSNPDTTNLSAEYTLKDNENIRLLAPSFITKRSFSNYTKFILKLHSTSLVSQRIQISDATLLEPNKDYYMRKDDWATVVNNIIDVCDKIQDDEGLEIGTKYQNLESWIDSYNAMTGTPVTVINNNDIIKFYKEGEEVTDLDSLKVTSFATGGIWRISDSLHIVGRLMTTTTLRSGIPTYEISEYDPVYQTLRGSFPDSEEIKVYDYVETYSIPAETDYQLREGESITFFWREEDGEDVPYKYECYRGISHLNETSTKKSPIIKANFSLKGQPIDSEPFVDTLSSSGQILNGDDGWNTIVSLYGDNDLSGTKSIDIRSMNQYVLDRVNGHYKKMNKIYFITNNTDADNYVLTLNYRNTYSVNNISSYRYTLQDNEFFIYTLDDGNSFEMLSAGTLIGIDTQYDSETPPPTITYEVEKLSLEEIQSEGARAFYSLTTDVNSAHEMFCREQQIYSIVGGDRVNINITDPEKFAEFNCGTGKLYENIEDITKNYILVTSQNAPENWKTEYKKYCVRCLEVTYDEVSVDGPKTSYSPEKITNVEQQGNELLIFYEGTYDDDGLCSNYVKFEGSIDSLDTDLETVKNSYVAWSNDNTLKLFIPDFIQSLDKDNENTYYISRIHANDSYEPRKYYVAVLDSLVPYFCSWVDTYVKGFTLKYTSNNSEIALPLLDIQNDLDCVWAGRSFVNINTSSETSQTITGWPSSLESNTIQSTQSLIIGDQTYPEPPRTGGLIDKTSNSSVELRSSVYLDKVGGQNIDISYLDVLGERQPTVLYVYSQNDDFNNGQFTIKDNGEIEVIIPNAEGVPGEENPTDEKIVSFLPGSEYVFSIYNPSVDYNYKLCYKTAEGDEVDAPSLSTGEVTSSYGRTYYRLPYDTEYIKFTFVKVGDSTTSGVNEHLTISKVFRCKLNDVLTDEYSYLFNASGTLSSTDVADCIKNYDYKGIFKYDYEPEVDKKIMDPLKGASFFDADHFANRYTIARCSLRLSDSSDSKITIVNNR